MKKAMLVLLTFLLPMILGCSTAPTAGARSSSELEAKVASLETKVQQLESTVARLQGEFETIKQLRGIPGPQGPQGPAGPPGTQIEKIQAHTIGPYEQARAVYDPATKTLHLYIPRGEPGPAGPAGPPGS